MIRTMETVPYEIRGPFMDQSVPSIKVQPPGLSLVVGADTRYAGTLKKFWGMKSVLDLSGITGITTIGDANGPSFLKPVSFLKTGTATMIRGFVVRWDSGSGLTDEAVSLVWSADNGATWTHTAIYAVGNNISSTADMACDTYENFLLVTVAGETPKTVYWNSSMQVVDMGPGAFVVALAVPTKVSSSADTSYYLAGDGTYQIAYRFYNSTRGIYSALSTRLTVVLDHIKETKASGYLYFNAAGGDVGLFVDGDKVTVGTRVYEADSNSAITGNVAVTITGLTTIAQMATALADAVNGDASAVVTAHAGETTVLFEAKTRGPSSNAYAFTKSEAGGNTTDLVVSGATLTGGGDELQGTPEEQCKIIIQMPNDTTVVAGQTYATFAALYDYVDVYRSGDLSGGPSEDAVLFLEQTFAMPANEGLWDAKTVSVGTMPDASLYFQKQYNPETDIVKAPPSAGALARYQGQTFMNSAVSDDGGLDICHSSIEHESPEYFTTFNVRRGSAAIGCIRLLIQAGDSLFALGSSGVVHIYKSSSVKPLQYTDLHRGRTLQGQGCAHAVGNSLLVLSPTGLMLLNGNDGNMGQLSSADRIVYERWVGDQSTISSGFDAVMNTSYLLHPGDAETLCVGHGTQSLSLLKGTNFKWVSEGLDMATGTMWRVFFISAKGRIFSPDYNSAGSGTMYDISSAYTLNGTVTSATGTGLTDSGATFHASMIGSLLYMTSGAYRGQCQTITSRAGTTLGFSTFGGTVAVGDTYAISPVPFEVKFPRLYDPNVYTKTSETHFQRWALTGVQAQFVALSGFSGNVNDQVYIEVYRHGAIVRLAGDEAVQAFTISANPADAVVALRVDGVVVEPCLTQISAGTSFELTEVAAAVKMTSSMNVNPND